MNNATNVEKKNVGIAANYITAPMYQGTNSSAP